jgi:hypothetical protein
MKSAHKKQALLAEKKAAISSVPPPPQPLVNAPLVAAPTPHLVSSPSGKWKLICSRLNIEQILKCSKISESPFVPHVSVIAYEQVSLPPPPIVPVVLAAAPSFDCDICGKKYATAAALKTHKTKYHTQGRKSAGSQHSSNKGKHFVLYAFRYILYCAFHLHVTCLLSMYMPFHSMLSIIYIKEHVIHSICIAFSSFHPLAKFIYVYT